MYVGSRALHAWGGDGGFVKGDVECTWARARYMPRFRYYVIVGLLYATGGMVFVSFVPVLLTKRLQCSYVAAALLLHIVPGVFSFLSTGFIGRWIDRSNPWKAWSWIRLGWN